MFSHTTIQESNLLLYSCDEFTIVLKNTEQVKKWTSVGKQKCHM